MAKRESKAMRELKKKWSVEQARATRQARREHFTVILEKDKIETIEDFYDLFHGLSKRAVDKAAYHHLVDLAVRDHFSPRRIVEFLEHGRLE